MVHLEMMSRLFDALPEQARIVLLGDKDQLSSVEAGAVLGALCEDAQRGAYRPDTAAWVRELAGQELPQTLCDPRGPALAQATIMLRRSRRFGGSIGQLALAIHDGDAARCRSLLQQAGAADAAIHLRHAAGAPQIAAFALRAGGDGADDCSHDAYLRLVHAGPVAGEEEVAWAARVLRAFDRFRVLSPLRDGELGVLRINQAIEAALAAQGSIAQERIWYAGRPLLVTRNDRELRLFNGDVGVVLPPRREGEVPRACFCADGGVRFISVARLGAVETCFAMTIHKSQGSEFEHVALVLPAQGRGMGREMLYTAVTRARARVTLFAAEDGGFEQALAQRARRRSGLAAMLQRAITEAAPDGHGAA